MKVLLIKPESVGIFSLTSQVDHEPLELEYLAAALKQQGHQPMIYDRRHDHTPLGKKLRVCAPQVVCLTAYINQEPLAKRIIAAVKAWNGSTVVIAGGSHIELNYANFYNSKADYLYHLSGLDNFMQLIHWLADASPQKDTQRLRHIQGLCYRSGAGWVDTGKAPQDPNLLPLPDRSYFYSNLSRYGYLRFRPLALVKNAFSCTHSCSFCYCTNINGGQYACRDAEALVDEIEQLDVPYIHITDDNFLCSPAYLDRFLTLLQARNIHKQFLIYGRADFIAQNPELIQRFAALGLVLVMVGLEALDERELHQYNKKVTLRENEQCIAVLRQAGVICAGLFIVRYDMNKQDFTKLYRYIAEREIIPTVSIFTPMQGAADYAQYKDSLLDDNVCRQDLYHCLLQPRHMSVAAFYRCYYTLMLRLFWNKRKSPLYAGVGMRDFFRLPLVLFLQIRRKFIL